MEPERRGSVPHGPARDSPDRESRRRRSSLPKGDETLYAFRMEVSLERLAADRFLQQAVIPANRRRFGLKRQQPAVPAR